MSPTKVIFSTDQNPLYLEFKEPIKNAWTQLGFEPVCIELSELDCYFDPNVIPLGNQAQIIRVLYPALYPDEKFIISDIDMLPLSKLYFEKLANLIENKKCLINTSADAYPSEKERFPICYYAGYGSAFKEITGINNKSDISNKMFEWYKLGFGWDTDELCFYQEIKKSIKKIDLRLYSRGWIQGKAISRIDRDVWIYDQEKLKNNQYIDSHLLRPYSKNKDLLEPLFESINER